MERNLGILDVANEFSISKDTIADFLASKGFIDEDVKLNLDKPDYRLTEAMYAVLEAKYAKNLAERKIEACLYTKNVYLDIGRCGLTDIDFDEDRTLSKLLKQCTHLKTLILSNEWWDNEEVRTVESENIQELNVFSKLPEALAFIKDLDKLICSGYNRMRLKTWPISEISLVSQLPRLRYLNLSDNHINKIQSLGSLASLETLILSSNQISDIRSLASLEALKMLDLSYNQIKDIEGLASLKSLHEIYLSHNHIRWIKGLSSLKTLKKIYISHNKITEINEEIKKLGALKSLSMLDLSFNFITEIEGLTYLKSLETLELSFNEITDIKGLDSLKALTKVNLSNNSIADIQQLGFVLENQDLFLNVFNNPLVEKYQLSLEPDENHAPFIRDLLRRQESVIKESFNFPVKVLMLGNHATGKSTIVNYLIQKQSAGSTHILRIENYHRSSGPNPVALPDAVFYDFGGQDFYHGLYQAFISHGALQLIVFDKLRDQNKAGKDTVGNSIFNYNRQYWLGQKRYKERDGRSPDPYIIIQTFADKPEAEEAIPIGYSDYGGYKSAFFLSFNTNVSEAGKVSEAVYEAGRKYLKAYFDNEVTKILKSNLREEPPWYIEFLKFVLDKKDKDHKPVRLNEILNQYGAEGMNEDERLESLKTCLTNLHRHGLVLYYQNKGLDEVAWLHPQALVKYIQENVLSKEYIQDKKGRVPKASFEQPYIAEILQLLKEQKVIFLHKPSIENPGLNEYIIPNYLPPADENDPEYQLLSFGLDKPNFVLKFDDFIPFGLINQMVCFYGKQPDAKKFWRDQLVFTLNRKARVMIKLDLEKLMIKVYLQILNNSDSTEDVGQDNFPEESLTKYLFLSIMALYWGFENDGIPDYEAFKVYERDSKSMEEGDKSPAYKMLDELQKENRAPDDAYISVDDTRFISYKDLIRPQTKSNRSAPLPLTEQLGLDSENDSADITESGKEQPAARNFKIASYSINSKDHRIDKTDSKEIPVSTFSAFTSEELPSTKKVFISYSHDDIAYRLEMQKYLVNLERAGLIEIWQDGLIQAGDDWDKKIKEGLNSADISIMLLSQSFIVSNYIYEVEIRRLLARRIGESIRIIPVLIKECDWKNWEVYPEEVSKGINTIDKNIIRIKNFQFLPHTQEQRIHPVNKWLYPEDAWLQVSAAIQEFCKPNRGA